MYINQDKNCAISVLKYYGSDIAKTVSKQSRLGSDGLTGNFRFKTSVGEILFHSFMEHGEI